MAGTRLEVSELAGSGLLEPLGGTFSGFELGHCFHLSLIDDYITVPVNALFTGPGVFNGVLSNAKKLLFFAFVFDGI